MSDPNKRHNIGKIASALMHISGEQNGRVALALRELGASHEEQAEATLTTVIDDLRRTANFAEASLAAARCMCETCVQERASPRLMGSASCRPFLMCSSTSTISYSVRMPVSVRNTRVRRRTRSASALAKSAAFKRILSRKLLSMTVAKNAVSPAPLLKRHLLSSMNESEAICNTA
jgi:hypothetical protein